MNVIIWELRHHVALRAVYYLSLRLDDIDLRAAALDHVAAMWALSVNAGLVDFDKFFVGYCNDVERDTVPEMMATSDSSWELHRVWTNHALVLRGEQDTIVDLESLLSERRAKRRRRRRS